MDTDFLCVDFRVKNERGESNHLRNKVLFDRSDPVAKGFVIVIYFD